MWEQNFPQTLGPEDIRGCSPGAKGNHLAPLPHSGVDGGSQERSVAELGGIFKKTEAQKGKQAKDTSRNPSASLPVSSLPHRYVQVEENVIFKA